MAEVKRVAYAYSSVLEDAGDPAYFLDCFVYKDNAVVVDRHSSYTSRGEFFKAMEEVIPILEEVSSVHEDRKRQTKDVRRDSEEVCLREEAGQF